MTILPMPVFPGHIYPALKKFPNIPENEQTQFIHEKIFAQLDPCFVNLLSAVMGLLNGTYRTNFSQLILDVSSSVTLTKMSPLNLAIVITLTLLHHPHDPRLDAQLSNPNQGGGAALLVIHLITHHNSIFPNKPLPPPPNPPRPLSTPPATITHPANLSHKPFLTR